MDWSDLKNNFQDKIELKNIWEDFFQFKLLIEARLASRLLSFLLSCSLYTVHFLFRNSIELQLKETKPKLNKPNNFAIKKNFTFHNLI